MESDLTALDFTMGIIVPGERRCTEWLWNSTQEYIKCFLMRL